MLFFIFIRKFVVETKINDVYEQIETFVVRAVGMSDVCC